MKKDIVVLGAGTGGLSVAWMLSRSDKYNVAVLECADKVGGVCGTFNLEEYSLDYGPHKFYSTDPAIVDEIKGLMGEELITHEKKNRIYIFGDYLKYPISMVDLLKKAGMGNILFLGIGALKAAAIRKDPGKAISYEDYIVSKFGRRMYELVFASLADKVWGDPTTLSSDIAKTRIPTTNIMDLVLRASGLKKESRMTDARYFYYPRNGFGRITERIAEEIKNKNGVVMTNVEPKKIIEADGKIDSIDFLQEGRPDNISFDLLVSAIPLGNLADLLISPQNPDSKTLTDSVGALQYRDAFLVYLFLNKEQVTEDHWIFFPDRGTVFSRVFEQKNMSPDMVPKNGTVLCCDFTDDRGVKLWHQSDRDGSDLCLKELEKVGLIKKADVIKTTVKRIPKFYPRYDLNYKQKVSAIYDHLKTYENLLLTGRAGFYNYNNFDHCIDMGKFIADNLEKHVPIRKIWGDLEDRVSNYRIVD
jgi:protoporphyrinogen oxidase